MNKRILVLFSVFFSVLLLSVSMVYAEDLPIFHLDTTSINFTDDKLTKTIDFNIKTNGNDNGTFNYSVTTENIQLIGQHNNSNKAAVNFTNGELTGSIDLSKESTIENSFEATLTKPSKSDEYFGAVMVSFTNTSLVQTIDFDYNYNLIDNSKWKKYESGKYEFSDSDEILTVKGSNNYDGVVNHSIRGKIQGGHWYHVSASIIRSGIVNGSLRGFIPFYTSSSELISWNEFFTLNNDTTSTSNWTLFDNFFYAPTDTYSGSGVPYGGGYVFNWHPANTGDVNLKIKDIFLSEIKKQNYSRYEKFTILPTAPSREGYEFLGWFTDPVGGTQITEESKVDDNIRYYAHWEAISYTITYDLNGGNNNSDNPTTYTIKDSITLKEPAKNGYSFLGWTVGKNLFDYELINNSFGFSNNSNSEFATSDSRKGYTIGLNYNSYPMDNIGVDLKNGDTLSISFDIKASENTTARRIFYCTSTSYNTYGECYPFLSDFNITQNYQRYSGTIKLTQDATFGGFAFYPRYDDNSNEIDFSIKNIQIENGNKVTAYETHISNPTKEIDIINLAGNRTYVANWVKTEELFPFKNSVQTFTAPVTGTYKLEVWGGQGGSYVARGGYGAYSVGEIYLEKGTPLYIATGGTGISTAPNAAQGIVDGGYNGGGKSGVTVSGSGGGATHIALKTGLLSSLSDSKGEYDNSLQTYLSNDILIVAGGGGGSGCDTTTNCTQGGDAGGYIGNTIAIEFGGCLGNASTNCYGTGGTQTSGGAKGMFDAATNTGYAGLFGLGGDGKRIQSAEGNGGGGGGGFFGGGGAAYNSGGGGSGYIGNTSLINKSMFCFNCKESSIISTKTISTTGTNTERNTITCPLGYSTDAISKCAKAGNGYAKITFIE